MTEESSAPSEGESTSSTASVTPMSISDKVTWFGGHLSRRLGQLKRWREDLSAAIHAYQDWVEQQGLTDGEEDLRVYELVDALQNDKLTIALAAEFSRGK